MIWKYFDFDQKLRQNWTTEK